MRELFLLLLVVVAAVRLHPYLAEIGMPVEIQARLLMVVFLLALVWPRLANRMLQIAAGVLFLYLLHTWAGPEALMQLGVLALTLFGLWVMARPLHRIKLGNDATMALLALGLLAVLVYFLAGLAGIAGR